MKLHTEHITENSRYWKEINILAKEAFPPEEYLAPQALVEMSKTDSVDFLALSEQDALIGFMVVKTYKTLAYLFFSFWQSVRIIAARDMEAGLLKH